VEHPLSSDDESPDGASPSGIRWPKPATETLIGRALRLRCPRCGVGKMFRGMFSMNERCPNCNLRYERAPGYFLGSSYINYGLTAVAILVLYVALHYWLKLSNQQLAAPLGIFCIAFPLLFFRQARSLWLALDCRWDPALMTSDEDE
jgi:uncharacterized protein (DUF983 family)